MWMFVSPRNRQTAADICINKSTCFVHTKIRPLQPCCYVALLLSGPATAAAVTFHTCENDRVPSSMITALRGRQRECVLLDGSKVQQQTAIIFGGKQKTKIHPKSTLQRNDPIYYINYTILYYTGSRINFADAVLSCQLGPPGEMRRLRSGRGLARRDIIDCILVLVRSISLYKR